LPPEQRGFPVISRSYLQPWRAEPSGIRLVVRASPKSAREGIEGVVDTAHGPALVVRVRAPAERGEANRAIERAVAAWLGVPRSTVTVAAGAKSRLKMVAVSGEPNRLMALAKMSISD
jgi:uncharacterized protein YggU (UPF0235/DUF167 family)